MGYDTNYLSGPIYFAGKGAAQMWMYDDTAAVATVIASGYISDGATRGLQQGDFVLYRKFDSLTTRANPSVSLHTVTSVSGEDVTLSAAIGDTSGLTVPVTSSTGTPGTTADTADGYMLGSIWVETDQDQAYVAVDVTEDAAIWRPIVDQFVLTQTGISIDSNGTTGSIYLPVPQPANLIKAYTVLSAVTTDANNATITLSRNSTAITNGVITIGGTTGIGTTDSCTPSAANTFAAGDVLTGVVGGTQVNSSVVSFAALFERLPA
jgi:hypothetical protein